MSLSAPAAPRPVGAAPDRRCSLRLVVGVHGGGANGIDAYAENVAAAAASAATDVTLLVTHAQLGADVTRRLGPDVRVLDLGLDPPTRNRERLDRLSPHLAARRLERALGAAMARLDERFDVAHLNHPVLAGSMREAADRVVVAAWFSPPAAVPRALATWRHTGRRFPRSAALALKGIAHERNDRRGFAAADCIVAPTDELTAQLLRIGHCAVTCPPPCRRGARVEDDAPGASPRPAGQPPRLVLCSGDLGHPRKNAAAALAAAGLLGGTGRPLALELVGGNAEALASHLAGLPPNVTVRMTGRLSPTEAQAVLGSADALLLPSLYEEWGYVAVEAALYGTPVVTFPVYPFSETLPAPLGHPAADMSTRAYAAALAGALDSGVPRAEVAAAAARLYGPEAVARRLTALWRPPHA